VLLVEPDLRDEKTAEKVGRWNAGRVPSWLQLAPAREEKGLDSMDKPENTLSSEP
jgi:hypothetical protein